MILDTIAAATRKRVAAQKKIVSQTDMETLARQMQAKDFPFKKALKSQGISFICEVKKASPSKGIISEDFPYLQTAVEYEAAGAAAISVLTEPEFFLGKNEYLSEISQAVKIPVLRKDFIIDSYQIFEAKVIGADAVLLICALLDDATLREYISLSRSLGLDVLVEAHNEREVEMALSAGAGIIGVNNRDLRSFKVEIQTCISLRPVVPRDIVFVAESGIKTADDIKRLEEIGADAVLIGDTMMRSANKKSALSMLRGEGPV